MVKSLIAAIAAVFATACLGTHYQIPREDLQRLASGDPHQRAESVRVIQGFAGDDGPPPAPEVSSTTVIVTTPGPNVGPRRRVRGPRRGRFGGFKLAKSKADESKVWIALAVIAGGVLAMTEGARYDGWVAVHPMHPVHLYGPYGEYYAVPLAQLDPQTAAWARKAFIRENEGPWRPLGRAPLNRRGLSYSFYLGAGEFISADGSDDSGFMGHIQFAVFPLQELGIAVDFGLGWGQNRRGETVFDSRYALELDVLPLAAGKVHGGVFAQGGVSARFEDGISGEDRSDLLVGGGALLQYELTTRLTLSARAGATRVYDNWVADAGLGLSVY